MLVVGWVTLPHYRRIKRRFRERPHKRNIAVVLLTDRLCSQYNWKNPVPDGDEMQIKTMKKNKYATWIMLWWWRRRINRQKNNQVGYISLLNVLAFEWGPLAVHTASTKNRLCAPTLYRPCDMFGMLYTMREKGIFSIILRVYQLCNLRFRESIARGGR